MMTAERRGSAYVALSDPQFSSTVRREQSQ